MRWRSAAGPAASPRACPIMQGAVLAVEIDPTFFVLAQETIGGRDNVVFVHADILKGKNQINPDVLAALNDLRAARAAMGSSWSPTCPTRWPRP